MKILTADTIRDLYYRLPNEDRQSSSFYCSPMTLQVIESIKDEFGNKIFKEATYNKSNHTIFHIPIIIDRTMEMSDNIILRFGHAGLFVEI